MNEKAQAEYERLVTRAILKHGLLVRKDPSIYLWVEENMTSSVFEPNRHHVSCGISRTGKLVEDATWYEFAGTFADSDDEVHGMELSGVFCKCGQLKNRTIRWEVPAAEAIKLVLFELLSEEGKTDDPTSLDS